MWWRAASTSTFLLPSSHHPSLSLSLSLPPSHPPSFHAGLSPSFTERLGRRIGFHHRSKPLSDCDPRWPSWVGSNSSSKQNVPGNRSRVPGRGGRVPLKSLTFLLFNPTTEERGGKGKKTSQNAQITSRLPKRLIKIPVLCCRDYMTLFGKRDLTAGETLFPFPTQCRFSFFIPFWWNVIEQHVAVST